jgi:UDP-glucose:(heptosyl)LPS alpha-1,3-glucosyltransferase
LRIALIRKNYSPYGGAENYLKLVAKGLKTKGHDVHIFSASNWPEESGYVHRVRTIKKPSFLSNMLFALNVRDALRMEYFDCVFSFERIPFYPVGDSVPNRVYRAGDGCHREWLDKRKVMEPFLKKLSFTVNPHHLVLLYLEKKCFSGSKFIIANSIMVKRDIAKHYLIPDEKIKVIYNGVDLQRFQPVKKEKKTALKNFFRIQEDKVILFVGADLERKGLSTLLKAVSLLGMRERKVVVVGKKETAQYLLMAQKLGIDEDVIFWGTEQEIEKLYSIADVFVLPTIYDPFSNATLEAMASGLPVITTLYNGASELIENGVQGFVIDAPLDTSAFAEKISTALQQAEDMGKKARIKAEKYSIEKAVERNIEVILNETPIPYF